MKKFVGFVISVIAVIVLLAYLFEVFIVFNSSISGANKVGRILNETIANEIPIFGSSRAKRNYVPSELGANFYNYGIEGVQDNVVLFFLREELKKDKNTPIIINFDLDGANSVNGDIKNYLPFIRNKEVAELVERDLKSYYYIPYLRYYGHFEAYLKDYLNEIIQQTEVSDNGAALFKGKVDQKTFDKYVKSREDAEIIVEYDEDLKEEYYNLCSNTKRQILFVVSPNHISYEQSIVNNDENITFFNQMRSLPNVELINFYGVNYPDEYFFNTTHLNYLGALEFTKSLKDSLKLYIEIDS